ncbi:MAG: 1,4-alpha-glucan branching protein GlgB [Bacillaceae bacterium]
MKEFVITHPTDFDLHLFHEGNLYKAYTSFGAHVVTEDGVKGVRFTVWAPHAKQIRVIGSFNHWNGVHHGMRKVNNEGVWTLFIPEVEEFSLYKYEIVSNKGTIHVKSDPYATYSEMRPNTASIVYDLGKYKWNDKKWINQKKKKVINEEPFSIYEVHVGTWRKKGKGDNDFYSYSELAETLIPYVLEHGFTHIELMPLIEHPFDGSWGYQGTGYYSITSRYGKPEEFMYFVDQCHQNGLGVIMDWVPGHFCKDAHGLYMFDGEATYEYLTHDVRENIGWGTANFDLSKPEVQSFLISNALFWMEKYHIDGFRVDAVANMLYWNKDYHYQENPYAAPFLRKLNEAVFAADEKVLMIAEDSTSYPLVTAPTYAGGLGFSYKWNMGWMNDVLKYMETEPIYRQYIHNKMTFSFLYAYSENFILPFSHDEVVHGKRSLLNKMPGDYWKKFAQLRLLYGFMFAHPGKKLLFMGGEFGQFIEWKDSDELDWLLLDYEMHRKMDLYFKELSAFYRKTRALWEVDHSWDGFEWIDADNHQQSIFSFIRKGKKKDDIYIIVCNFNEFAHENFKLGVPTYNQYTEVFNSDDEKYGGSGKVNKKRLEVIQKPLHNQESHVEMTIPPFGVSIIRPVKSRKGKKKDEAKKVRSDVTSRGKGNKTTSTNRKNS